MVKCVPEKFRGHLADAMRMFSICTQRRRASFLATVIHETGGFNFMREVWGPTVYQKRYAGRYGNNLGGDGYKYRGGGLIQITFKDNYRRVNSQLREKLKEVPDLVLHPELIVEPKWASYSAACWWTNAGCNIPADREDLHRVRQIVNGCRCLGEQDVHRIYHDILPECSDNCF